MSRMLAAAVLLAALAVQPAAAAGAVPGAPLASVEAAAFPQTCRHYDNRARFLPRGEAAPFLAQFADGCRAALAQARDDGEAARRARDYLRRLTRLRQVVTDLNMRRMYGNASHAGVLTRSASVSRTGEYLIARLLGVTEALEAWRGAGPQVSGEAR
jgi:hypothetical protein